MKLGFTGTRRGMTPKQKEQVRKFISACGTEFHHGDCIGADAQAAAIAKDLGVKTIAHPPDKKRMRAFAHADICLEPLPYLERNKKIVDDTETLMACPYGIVEEVRSGTWSTVRYARRLGRTIMLFLSDGTVREEYHAPPGIERSL